MEIKKVFGELNPYASQKLQENQRIPQDQAATGTTNAQQLGDKVALSPEAKLLATAMSTANAAPDTRAEKVRELKEQIQAGTYKPDIRKAAANLLRDEVNLTR
jgi:negative regulator of flagellin synthesis FlgM